MNTINDPESLQWWACSFGTDVYPSIFAFISLSLHCRYPSHMTHHCDIPCNTHEPARSLTCITPPSLALLSIAPSVLQFVPYFYFFSHLCTLFSRSSFLWLISLTYVYYFSCLLHLWLTPLTFTPPLTHISHACSTMTHCSHNTTPISEQYI